jgi:hypothetical protein
MSNRIPPANSIISIRAHALTISHYNTMAYKSKRILLQKVEVSKSQFFHAMRKKVGWMAAYDFSLQ